MFIYPRDSSTFSADKAKEKMIFCLFPLDSFKYLSCLSRRQGFSISVCMWKAYLVNHFLWDLGLQNWTNLILLFHHIGLTQTFTGVAGADLCHGNKIKRITLCLANSKSQLSFLCLNAVLQSYYFEKLLTWVWKYCWSKLILLQFQKETCQPP